MSLSVGDDNKDQGVKGDPSTALMESLTNDNNIIPQDNLQPHHPKHSPGGAGDETCSSSSSSLDDDLFGGEFGGEDEDDLMELSGTIPCEEDKPTVHYLGREYKMEETVLKSIDSSLHKPTTLTSGSSHQRRSGTSRRRNTHTSSGKHNSSTNNDDMENNGSMRLCESEHLSDRWSRLAEEVEASLPKTMTSPPSLRSNRSSSRQQRRNKTAMTSQSEHLGSTRRDAAALSLDKRGSYHGITTTTTTTTVGGGRRASVNKYIQVPPTNTTKDQLSQSEHFFNGQQTRRATITTTATSLVGGGLGLSMSEHRYTGYGSRRASTSTATDYLKHVGKKLVESTVGGATANKQQHDKWGYTSTDVQAIIDDPAVFAKLQRDLRARKAVTDNILKERLHVFVHNTKKRELKQNDAEDLQEEYQQAQREQEERQTHGKPCQGDDEDLDASSSVPKSSSSSSRKKNLQVAVLLATTGGASCFTSSAQISRQVVSKGYFGSSAASNPMISLAHRPVNSRHILYSSPSDTKKSPVISTPPSDTKKPPGPLVLWKFARPHTMIGSALAIPALSILAAPSFQAAFSVSNIVAAVYAMIPSLLMNIYITGLNQVTDVEIDKINKPFLPIASGELSMKNAIITCLVTVAVSLSMGLANPILGSSGLNTALWGSFLFGTMYSLPPFRLKRFPLLAAFCIVAVRGTIINAGFFAHARSAAFGVQSATALSCLLGDLKCLLSSLFFGVFGIVIALMKDIPDVRGDALFNVSTFSVRIGQKRIFLAMRSLLMGLFFAFGAGFARGAIMAPTGLLAAFRGMVGAASMTAGLSVRKKAQLVDPEDPKEVYGFYMHLWKLFYLSYLALPFVR